MVSEFPLSADPIMNWMKINFFCMFAYLFLLSKYILVSDSEVFPDCADKDRLWGFKNAQIVGMTIFSMLLINSALKALKIKITELKTEKIQTRWLIMSHLIQVCIVCPQLSLWILNMIIASLAQIFFEFCKLKFSPFTVFLALKHLQSFSWGCCQNSSEEIPQPRFR